MGTNFQWITISIDRSLFFIRIQMKPHNSVPAMKCGVNGTQAVSNFSVLETMCPIVVIFLQFSISSMFMWMLCEGIHLNNILTVSVFKNHFKTYYFYILGWGETVHVSWDKINQKKPHFLFSYSIFYDVELDDSDACQRTSSKVGFSCLHSSLIDLSFHRCRCWANYNYLKYYWIIDGPRYAVMIVYFSN